MAHLRSLGVVVATWAAAGALWQLRGSLGTPDVSSWSAATRWYDAAGPTAALVAGTRVVAMALAVWLALATTVALVAAIHPWSGAGALADLVAPRSLQRLVHGLAGLSLTAGLALPAPSAGILGTRPALASLVVQADPGAGDGTATMHLVDPPDADAPAVAGPEVGAPVVDAPAQVVVVPGDSFWSIAETALREGGASAPDDAEVARYWRAVIDHNRSALVDPSTPDLIYSGQVFTLPGR